MDLYLIHFPHEHRDIPAAWKMMEEVQTKGLARSIGVSNFTVLDLMKLEGSAIKPAVNQVIRYFLSHSIAHGSLTRVPIFY